MLAEDNPVEAALTEQLFEAVHRLDTSRMRAAEAKRRREFREFTISLLDFVVLYVFPRLYPLLV